MGGLNADQIFELATLGKGILNMYSSIDLASSLTNLVSFIITDDISVIQYSLYGDKIEEYPSLMEASRKTNVPVRAICACCKNYQKSAFGYVWKYKNDGT